MLRRCPLGDEPLRRWLQPTAVGWRPTAVSCSSNSISVGALVDPPVWDVFFFFGLRGRPVLYSVHTVWSVCMVCGACDVHFYRSGGDKEQSERPGKPPGGISAPQGSRQPGTPGPRRGPWLYPSIHPPPTPLKIAPTPGTLGTTPGTLETTPSTLGTSPSTLGTTPSTLWTSPSTLGTTP